MGQTGGDSGNVASRLTSTLPIPLLCVVISAALSVRESFRFMQKTKMTRNSRAHALIVGSKEQISLIDLIISLIQMLPVTSMW